MRQLVPQAVQRPCTIYGRPWGPKLFAIADNVPEFDTVQGGNGRWPAIVRGEHERKPEIRSELTHDLGLPIPNHWQQS